MSISIVQLVNYRIVSGLAVLVHPYFVDENINLCSFNSLLMLNITTRFLIALCRYLQALSTHRADGYLHRRIGELIDAQGDKADAFQYYFDVSPNDSPA